MTKQIKISMPSPDDAVAVETAISFLYSRGYVVAKKTNLQIAHMRMPVDQMARHRVAGYVQHIRTEIAQTLGHFISKAAVFTEQDDPHQFNGRTLSAMIAVVAEFEEPRK